MGFLEFGVLQFVAVLVVALSEDLCFFVTVSLTQQCCVFGQLATGKDILLFS